MEVTTFTSEDRENAMKDEEYTGGIPIPFMGWAQMIDQEDTEKMLRDQLHMVNQKLQEANQLIGEQKKVLELYQEFIKEQNLFNLWMFFIGDKKDV
jgi:hypothetical protein